MRIYKITTAEQWEAAKTKGIFEGAPVDLADGFIHFSTAEQVAETADKHFRGQKNLTLLSVETQSLGNALKWEPSRDGALFPHLYAPLKLENVEAAISLDDLPDGSHRFPEVLP